MSEQNNKPLVDVVTLSKWSYDQMKAENTRAKMLLDIVLSPMAIDIDTDIIRLNTDKVLSSIEILYPETYKKKVSTLKTLRAKYMKPKEAN